VPEGYIMRNFSGEARLRPGMLFSEKGIVLPDSFFVTSFSVQLGRAVSRATEGKIALMKNDGVREERIYSAMAHGIYLDGGKCECLGNGFEASARYASTALGYDITVFIIEKDGEVILSIFDKDGLYPHRSFERKTESEFISGGFAHIPEIAAHDKIEDDYTNNGYYEALYRAAKEIGEVELKITSDNYPGRLLTKVLSRKGVKMYGDVFAELSDDGLSLSITAGKKQYDMAHIAAVLLRYYSDDRTVLPSSSPNMLKKVSDCKMIYTHCPCDDSEDEIRKCSKYHPELYDASFAVLKFMELMGKTNRSASELLDECPEFTVRKDDFYTASQKKLGVLSVIGKPSGDGVYVKYGDGGVRIISNKRGYALTSEAADGEYAEEIMSLCKNQIKRLLEEK